MNEPSLSKQLVLSPFQTEHASEIASWLANVDEARAWGGRDTSFPLEPTVFSEWHEDPDVHPFVAFIDDQLVGYGEIWPDEAEREIELARIIVRPSRRRTGIGGDLVVGLLERSKSFGFPVAYVRVVPENASAIRCYEQSGFARVSSEDQDRFNERPPIDYVWLVFRSSSYSGTRSIIRNSDLREGSPHASTQD